jgi:four helix bundle protein
MKENVIKDKSFAFALKIIALYKLLQAEKEFVLSKQLLRSATSIGANVAESESAQSTADFIHKLSISLKEARETRYWLQLLEQSELTSIAVDAYLIEIDEIIKILTAIITTIKKNKNS